MLALLALAGLLRPEAWVFSGLYWLYLAGLVPSRLRGHLPEGEPVRERGALVKLTLLAAAAPLVWLGSDLLVTGNPLWSLTNTRHTASALDRKTGIANVPEYVPRRIGEVLQAAALAGAILGAALSLWWLRARALVPALAAALAVAIFAAFAAIGLPIDTRYAFLAAAFGCLFCGAAVFGWTRLRRGDRRRGPWMAAGALVALALIATAPSQYRTAHHELDKLAAQERIEGDLVALVARGRGQPPLRPGRGAEPRADPAARAVPAREPSQDPQPGDRAHPIRRLRRPGQQRGRT